MKSGIQIRIKMSWIRHTVCNNRDPIVQIFQPGWTRQAGPDRLDQTGWTRQAGPDWLDQTGARTIGTFQLCTASKITAGTAYSYIKKTDAEKLMTWPWLKQHFFTC